MGNVPPVREESAKAQRAVPVAGSFTHVDSERGAAYFLPSGRFPAAVETSEKSDFGDGVCHGPEPLAASPERDPPPRTLAAATSLCPS